MKAGFAYQFTHHVMRWRGIYDPTATSYQGPLVIVGQGGTAPNLSTTTIAKPRINANATDLAIRQYLLQPRLQLVFAVGDIDNTGNASQVVDRNGALQNGLALSSPLLGSVGGGPVVPGQTGSYVCDCTGGPIVTHCDVWRIVGTTNYGVEIEITTDLNEWGLFFGKPPILLSNVWSASQDIDELGYTTRIIDGEVCFRRDVLAQQLVLPDDFRGIVIHPPIPGFKRTGVQISQMEDGCILKYRVTDEEKPVIPFEQNVMKVEAFFDIVSTNPGMESPLMGVGSSFLGGTVNFLKGAFALSPSQMFGAITGQIGGTVSAVASSLPSAKLVAACRVWGNKRSNIDQLLHVARRILFLRLGFPPIGKNSWSLNEHVSWTERFAVSVWTIELAGIVGAYQIIVNQANLAGSKLNKTFPNLMQDSTTETAGPFAGTRVLDARVPSANDNPQVLAKGFSDPNNANQTMGTYVASCLAQQLWNSTTNPPQPATDPTNQLKKTLSY